MSQQYPFQCNIAQALNIIGDKWSLLILHGIMSGHQTYKEIYNSLEGQIASNLLSSRLKALEADGLISSDLYQKHPPRYRYTLTPAGEDLNIVFNSLVLWGEKHLTTCYKRLIHKNCNHTVETHYYCPHCSSRALVLQQRRLSFTGYEPQQRYCFIRKLSANNCVSGQRTS